MPVFQQLVDRIADGILVGAYPEGSAVPSLNELAVSYTINPITASKGSDPPLVTGTLLWTVLVSAYLTAASTVLLSLEIATGHWFLGFYIFDVHLLGAGELSGLLPTVFLATLALNPSVAPPGPPGFATAPEANNWSGSAWRWPSSRRPRPAPDCNYDP